MMFFFNGSRYSYWDWMLTTKPGLFGLLPGWANITGVILILALTIMAVCSMPSVRRSGHFEVFYYSHLLYNVYFVLLVRVLKLFALVLIPEACPGRSGIQGCCSVEILKLLSSIKIIFFKSDREINLDPARTLMLDVDDRSFGYFRIGESF